MATAPTFCVTPGCVGDKAAAWFNEQLEELVTQMVEGLVGLAADIATAWVALPLVPSLGMWDRTCRRDPVDGSTVCDPPVFEEADIFQFFNQNLGWFGLACFVLGLMIVGIRIMWTQNGAELRDALKAILIYSIIASAGTAAVYTLLTATDLFSAFLLAEANPDQSFEDSIAAVLMLPSEAVPIGETMWLNGALSMVIGVLLLLFALLIFITQVLLLVIRGGLLVIMVIMLPIVAAAGTTQLGKSMMSKYLAWLLALILYKPAAAILYAMAFQLAGGEQAEDRGLLNIITGLTIFVAALFMLPALLRLIVPATQAVASGGGMGGLAAAGAGAAGAAGAMAVKSVMTGGAGAATAAGSQAAKSTAKSTQGGPAGGGPRSGGPDSGGGSPPGAGSSPAGNSPRAGNVGDPTGSQDSGPAGSQDSGPAGSQDSGPDENRGAASSAKPSGQGGAASSTKPGSVAGSGAGVQSPKPGRPASGSTEASSGAGQSRGGGQSAGAAASRAPGSASGTRAPANGPQPPSAGGSRGSASGEASYPAAPLLSDSQASDGPASGASPQPKPETAQNPWVSEDSPKGPKGSAAAEAARGAVSGAATQLGETARGAVGEDAEEEGGPRGNS